MLSNRLVVQLIVSFTIFAQGALSQDTICPKGPSQHLNENFPVKTLVLAVDEYPRTEIEKVVQTVFQNNSSENMPNLILFDGLNKTQDLFSNLNSKSKEAVKLLSDSVVWSQDFFEAFVDQEGRTFCSLC